MKHSAKAPESFAAALEAIDLLRDGGRIEIMQLSLRFRSVLHAAALGKAAHEIFNQGRELLEVPAAATLGFAGETGHAARHVSLEADALLFAVVADVDAGLGLAGDDVAHGAVHLIGQ